MRSEERSVGKECKKKKKHEIFGYRKLCGQILNNELKSCIYCKEKNVFFKLV